MTIGVCFIFVVSFTLMNNALAIQIIKEKTNNSVLHAAEQTDRYLSFLFNKAKSIAHVFSVNSSLEKLSNFGSNGKDSYYDFYVAIWDLYRASIYQLDLSGEIHSMYIYIDKVKYFINSQHGIYSYRYIKDSTWMNTTSNIKVSQQWISHYCDEGLSEENLISFVCRSDLLNRNIKKPVYISVNFLEQDIMKILEVMKITPNTIVYLIDKSNGVMAAENKSELGKPLDSVIDINLHRLKHEGVKRIKINNSDYYHALYKRNNIIDGGMVVLIPEYELLSEQRAVRVASIIIITLIVAIFTAFGIKMVIDYVDKPVSKLVSFMRKAEQGDFTNKIQEKRKDEFGYLFSSYNQMVEKIEKLIQDLYQEKLIKKEMEVKALQQQINPHFLYNTLDTINWIAKVNNIDSISNIVIALSNMYRITFNKGREFIRIGDMLESLRCYLDIQKIRYDNLFEYKIEVDEHIEDYWVLNLIVQTVVENAIIHGLDGCERKGLIHISASQIDDAIYFEVVDNGRGMGQEKLELITAMVNAENISSESGLRNAQKRLKLKHGPEYGLEIESELDKGTKVTIKVPVIKELEEEKMEFQRGEQVD